MTTLTAPSLPSGRGPARVKWGYRANVQVFTSDLSGSVQTAELPGLRWVRSDVYEALDAADIAYLEAYALQLNGQGGRVALGNPKRRTPRGSISGSLLVKGAGQTGLTLVCDGVPDGSTLLKGDFVSVGGQLLMLTANATMGGSPTEMVLTFGAALRVSPADNAAVTYTDPTCTFMLTNNEQDWNYEPGDINSISFDYVEVFA
jgi:hypothetical protein